MGVKAGPSKKKEIRIEAFEMKCIRKILRVSWTQKKRNEWVLEAAGVERGLLKMRKLSHFGHVMRREGERDLEKEIIQGTLPGARRQGRQRIRWIYNMMSFDVMRETVNGRRLRRLVHEAISPRNDDG